ncbi:TPA: VOC family protein [Photobacterium damselae]|uniref:VOC family protein n=1 Tax=Photobacterium damselae subsp. damselae TaxID=85581 RepID=A0AAD3ZVI8_PHODD|nr:VOC family protein [Photobacterium damselae]KAB1178462.1 VOC family protein [Photobacterium damselae subsp. damselae]KAB1182172.1 VOC family protein [Photobacterium damselae subsp. damselae]MBF7099380.1 VOC family protein [Photobacterium damselae]MCG3815269.1 VOC family protein [Photobacterium damselae]NVO74827.1 VOC family protein [Photobacterium damselae subsp. damselae]
MQKLKEIGLHPEQMLANLPAFMNKITSLLQELNISLTEYKADHIALRVNNYADAELLHQAWLEYGVEWSNNWINGRPIIVIGFTQPLQVGDWTIEALELPYPSNKTYPQQGWEHIEFVIPSNARTTDELKQHLAEQLPSLDWSGFEEKQVKVKASSPAGEKERLPNPTIAFKKDGVCIKLHPCSLKAVLESESE